MHLDVSQIHPRRGKKPPKDNFVMPLQFTISFEFKVAIKQYHMGGSAKHTFYFDAEQSSDAR